MKRNLDFDDRRLPVLHTVIVFFFIAGLAAIAAAQVLAPVATWKLALWVEYGI